MVDKVKVIQLPEEVQQKLAQCGEILSTITIDPEFWNPKQKWWTDNKNNHVMLTIVNYYKQFEKDDNIKNFVLPNLQLLAWLYVNHAAYRARIGWLVFFFDAYIADKQFIENTGDRMVVETWIDPRLWAQHLIDGTMDQPEILICRPRDPNEVVR